jgi:hypothetical protein
MRLDPRADLTAYKEFEEIAPLAPRTDLWRLLEAGLQYATRSWITKAILAYREKKRLPEITVGSPKRSA